MTVREMVPIICFTTQADQLQLRKSKSRDKSHSLHFNEFCSVFQLPKLLGGHVHIDSTLSARKTLRKLSLCLIIDGSPTFQIYFFLIK